MWIGLEGMPASNDCRATIEGQFFVAMSDWLFVYVAFAVGEKVNELESMILQLWEKPEKKFDLLECARDTDFWPAVLCFHCFSSSSSSSSAFILF